MAEFLKSEASTSGGDPQDVPGAGSAVASGIEDKILSCNGVEALFTLATRVHEDNKKTIDAIDRAAAKPVKYFSYRAPPVVNADGDGCSFTLAEEQREEPAGELVKEWKADVPLIEIFDIFNLKVSYECVRYTDLVRLNAELYSAVQRYNMFYDDESKKGRVEIAKFVRNLAGISGGLREVSALCADRPSRGAEIAKLLEQANAVLHRATRTAPLLQFSEVYEVPEFKELGVTRQQISTLSGWIPAPTSSGGSALSWMLRYQATKDGFGARDFHAMCDNQKRLLVVIKSQNDFIFGGFTSEGFTYPAGADPVAFLFTLTNPHGIPPTKLQTNGDGTASIYIQGHYGPTFGRGHDLHIANNANINNNSCSDLGQSYVDSTGRGA